MTIDILLSTYRGEKFVAEFIGSLARQTRRDFRLLVRDDGSDDATAAVVRDSVAAADIPAVFVPSSGEHLGVIRSFGELLTMSSASYVMFADQDDIWRPDKVEGMMTLMSEAETIHGEDTPILLHSDLRVCAADGAVVADSLRRYQRLSPRDSRLTALLIQNSVTGCAMMINRALRQLVRLPLPDEAVCHDWYLALVAAAFGRTVFSDTPYVDYRNHGANVFGPQKYCAADWFRVFRSGQLSLRRRLFLTQQQAGAFLRQYGDSLNATERQAVEAWAGIGSRSKFGRIAACLKFGFRKNTLLRTAGMWWAI